MTKAKTTPSRRAPLNAFLHAHNSACMWQLTNKPSKGQTIECWSVNGHLLIVHSYGDDGWNVFIPACQSNSINDTIAALEAYVK